ncbi:hypothetical protein BGZ93_011227 [Podila epicladia]|nr:hypothetical protein BGZ93_011227 [Podila epicladia]
MQLGHPDPSPTSPLIIINNNNNNNNIINTNSAVVSPQSPLHIPEILAQILPLLSQVDLRFGASLVCKDWYRIALPLIEWTTHWTDVLTPEEWDITLSQLASKTTHLVCFSKSYQIRYYMTITPAQGKENWETLHKALEQLHTEDKLLLQQVVINGPANLRAYLNPMLPFFRGITSLRLERVRTDEISLGVFFVFCPQLRSLFIDCDEQSRPIIKFGAGEVMPEEGQPLPLWSLTIKDVTITHASLLSIVTRSPELQEFHAERLVSSRASTHPPHLQEYLVNRNHILEALANHCPKLNSLHLSVRMISWRPTVSTMPPDDWRQELGRFPQLRSYSFQGQEATLATFPLLYDLQNHLTTLEIVGPKLTKAQEIQNRAANELRTFISEALHTYLCKSANLLHLKVGAVKYFADYFNAIRRVDYDGWIKQTGCTDCRPGSNIVDIESDDDDKDWMSGVWACRDLQTLEIRLTEKDKAGERHESELKSRMMFGYLTLVCPRLQKVSIRRQIVHFNKEGGLCLVSRWKELQQLRLSAKKYNYGVYSYREGPITMTACSDWAWLQRSSNWEGHLSEAGNMFLQTGKNLALNGLAIDNTFNFPTLTVINDDGSCLSSRQYPERQSQGLRDAMAMVGSVRDVADVYLERASRLLKSTGSWTGSEDVCLPSLEKIEIHQSVLDRNNTNTRDIKTELAKIRPEVLVVETH